MKCDFLTPDGTCNSEHTDASGLCSVHRRAGGETLRYLRAELITTKARLDGTTSAIPAIVANHTKSLTAENKRLRSALEHYAELPMKLGDLARFVLERERAKDRKEEP